MGNSEVIADWGLRIEDWQPSWAERVSQGWNSADLRWICPRLGSRKGENVRSVVGEAGRPGAAAKVENGAFSGGYRRRNRRWATKIGNLVWSIGRKQLLYIVLAAISGPPACGRR